ncbi:MAG: stage II sporulation protein M [Halobacteriaceae archaeon]
MRLEDAARVGVRLPLVRGGVVPVYLLGFAALLAARAPVMLGTGAALVVLVREGRLQPLLAELSQLGAGDLAPGEPLPPGLAAAIEGLLTPAAVGLFVSGVTAAAIAWVVGTAVASAAGVHALAAGLGLDRPGAGPSPDGSGGDTVGGREDDTVVAAVRGVSADTKTFVGLALARGAAGLGVPIVAFALLGVLPDLLGALVVIVALPGGPLLYLALGFAEQAAVLEGRDAPGALRRSLGFVRDEPDAFVGYLGTGFVALVALFVALVVVEALDASSAAALVALVAAPMVFDGFKTALFAGLTTPPERAVSVVDGEPATDAAATSPTDAAAADPGPDRTWLTRAEGRLRRAARWLGRTAADGLAALRTFALAHPVANLAAAAVLLAGGLAGYTLTADLGLELLAPGTAGAVAVEPSMVGQIWINNWTVVATSAYGGFALGVPVLTNLAFNGLLIGALAGVTDPTAVLALVAPHGVVELPAIAVGGGLGLVLGRRGWAALRGRRGAEALAADVRAAFDVLVGLAVLLLVAALIEALMTPLIGNAVL